jgi:sugar lactone lactonase YvrE
MLSRHIVGALVLIIAGFTTGCGVARVGGVAGSGGASQPATIPTISSQPRSATVGDGSPITFDVSAQGSGTLVFQWKRNGQPIPGAIGSAYHLGAVSLSDDGAVFTVVVSNSAGTAVSNAATLTVHAAAPTIIAQPQDQSVLSGAPAVFSVMAQGSAPLAFQWSKNGSAIAGATAASYLTPPTTNADSGATFAVTITNAVGSATSASATLTVTPSPVAPSIVTQPQSVIVVLDSTATFTVVVQGTAPFTYQWQRNGADLAGAVGATYQLSPATLANNQDVYTVTISNVAGSVTSQGAVLTVTASPPGIHLLAGMLGGSGNLDATGGAARFYGPQGAAIDAAGNIFVADNVRNTVREISAAGVVTTIAGRSGIFGSTDGGRGTSMLHTPSAVAVDAAGNVYVADTGNDTIRKVTPAGDTSTLAGTAGVTGSTDGPAASALFNAPGGIAVDGAGNLYVADSGNNTIRVISAAGTVSTLAGTTGVAGAADGTGAAAQFSAPLGITVDGAGNVFVADTANNTIRAITPLGAVTTVAGTAGVFGPLDGVGTAALFSDPSGITVDAAGNLYVADSGDQLIRLITPALVVSTIAGSGAVGSLDGNGVAAQFDVPWGIAVDAVGNLFIGDYGNDAIRKITPAAVVTTLAGTAPHPGATDASGSAASFNAPAAVATDTAGNSYIADSNSNTIRKVTAAGVVRTLAGTAGVVGSLDGVGGAAQFNAPLGIAVDAVGNVYVADTGNNTIRMITSAGVVTTLAGAAGVTGSADGTGAAASFNAPSALAMNAAGNLYVADAGNNTIRMVTAAGVVSTLAGSPGTTGSADGSGAAASFNNPQGITTDAAGNVYVADTDNHTIRKVSPMGAVTTLAGTPGLFGAADGTAAAAVFFHPHGLAIDTVGNLYVADTDNNTLRKVTPAGVVTTVVGAPFAAGVVLGPLPGSVNNPWGIALVPGPTLSLVVSDQVENSILVITFP